MFNINEFQNRLQKMLYFIKLWWYEIVMSWIAFKLRKNVYIIDEAADASCCFDQYRKQKQSASTLIKYSDKFQLLNHSNLFDQKNKFTASVIINISIFDFQISSLIFNFIRMSDVRDQIDELTRRSLRRLNLLFTIL